MATPLDLHIQPQPDDTTCGPTCLQAVYGHFGLELELEQVIREVPALEGGGTLAVLLANHALARGFRARIYTLNLQVMDPTWFGERAADLRERLEAQAASRKPRRQREASRAYVRYLDLGGELRFEDLTTALLRHHLKRGEPILTGLSATFLYRTAREVPGPEGRSVYDDVNGTPQGHFVVLCGYDRERREVLVADPLQPNPVADGPRYWVDIDRLVNAILLGALTHDANLLVLRPAKPASSPS